MGSPFGSSAKLLSLAKQGELVSVVWVLVEVDWVLVLSLQVTPTLFSSEHWATVLPAVPPAPSVPSVPSAVLAWQLKLFG
jgi:hypothetical protein